MLGPGPLRNAGCMTIILGVSLSKPAVAADSALVAAAKKEGEVTWYTTLIIDQN